MFKDSARALRNGSILTDYQLFEAQLYYGQLLNLLTELDDPYYALVKRDVQKHWRNCLRIESGEKKK